VREDRVRRDGGAEGEEGRDFGAAGDGAAVVEVGGGGALEGGGGGSPALALLGA
jgi:hypothetical protein